MPFFQNAGGTIASSSTFNDVAGNQINNGNSYPINNTHSNNSTKNLSNSDNDSSVRQNVHGTAGNVVGRARNVNNYHAPVNHGDRFNGPIYSSNVGGRGNVNTINMSNTSDGLTEQVQKTVDREAQLLAQLAQIRAQIEAKRAQQRIDKLAAEVAAAMSELAELNKGDKRETST